MSEQEMVSKDAQKTVVAFIAGLLIGGLLMWVFAAPGSDTDMNDEADEANVSEDDDDAESTSNTSTRTSGTNTKSNTTTTAKPSTSGVGDATVADQPAGSVVVLSSVMFPSDEGWIGVRDYDNGQLGGLLGVARFSAEQGLTPTQVELLRSTVAGSDYVVVFYSESGDREFSLADDVQLDAEPVVFSAR